MADENTRGVLLKGAEGHYFIPHSELGQFAVQGDADPEGTVAAEAPRVEAFTVQRTSVEAETTFSLAAGHDAARILAAPHD